MKNTKLQKNLYPATVLYFVWHSSFIFVEASSLIPSRKAVLYQGFQCYRQSFLEVGCSCAKYFSSPLKYINRNSYLYIRTYPTIQWHNLLNWDARLNKFKNRSNTKKVPEYYTECSWFKYQLRPQVPCLKFSWFITQYKSHLKLCVNS